MTLTFEAKFVCCNSAMDGEILQVSFDARPEGEGEEERDSPHVLLSRNFEFPGSATIDWHDGTDYDGGAKIVSVSLKRDRVLIQLDRDLNIDVSFQVPDREFARLADFLRQMVGERLCLAG